ncbi:hypothetical protein FEDK69T_21990 [Flavobacterium enshiense DK69]|nr:hypothetical protein FEDK69T_21990 [Flavobacterium enshiense DK69]
MFFRGFVMNLDFVFQLSLVNELFYKKRKTGFFTGINYNKIL